MIDEPRGPAATVHEPRLLAGLTGIGVIVLAAVAYSIGIALDPAAGSHLLTATFLLTNVAGWLLGSTLRRREPRSLTGLLLVLLADAIFPLNLFAPIILFAPGFRGNTALTATAVILIGIVYHAWNYRNRSSARFALPFYPYFFALAGVAALVLTRFTAGLPMLAVAWLVLAFAAAFHEASHRFRPTPALHFSIAGATTLTASVIVSAFAFRDRNPAALAAIVVATLVLIAATIRERGDESMARANGLAAWLGVTATFTALLYAFQSPLALYIVATGLWTIGLALISTLPARGWTEPFHESAWWAALLLATALPAVLWKFWTPFIIGTLPQQPFRTATTAGLLEVGGALAFVSIWRRRYPSIAATLAGFATNNILLRITTYAAPLLLTVGLAGAWPLLHGPGPANVYAPLAAGMLLLIAGPLLVRHYPTEALDFAGILAMIFSAFNGLASAMLSAAVLFAAALILLVRFVRGAATWTFYAFLLLTVGGLYLQPIGFLTSTVVFAAAAIVLGWGSSRATGAAARIGYWLAHGAGFVFWLSLARNFGMGHSYDALVLATWAWFAFAVWRLTRGKAADTSLHACVVLAASSLLTLWLAPAGTQILLASLLTIGALVLELRHIHYAGYALLALAVILATNRTTAPLLLIAVLAICAVVLLWRSLGRGSSAGHLLFVAAATAAAVLLMPHHGALQTLPVIALVALLLVVELIASRLHAASAFHGDMTSVVAWLLAATVLVAEVTSERYSLAILAILLLALIAIRPWIAVSEVHRVQPAAHAAFVVLGIVAGAVAIVAAVRLAGFTPGQQIVTLACTVWLGLAWLLRSGRGSVSNGATVAALHVIGAGVYAAALLVRNGDPLLPLACLITAGAWVLWRTAWRWTFLEHFAGAGAVAAICLWGMARHIAWPEYYLFAGSAYLCVVLLRRTAPRAESTLTAIVIVTAILYPWYALLRSAQPEHLAFLGVASVVVIHVLLMTRRHLAMVVAVCAMLGLGMLFGAAVLHGDTRLNLLMTLVGFLVIADLGVIGSRPDRQAFVGEID